MAIEHFKPKMKYPQDAYFWCNLLPSCFQCNLKKSDKDTGQYQIVNPTIDHVEDYFDFNHFEIVALNSIAEKTLEILGLNRVELTKARAKYMESLIAMFDNLKIRVENIENEVNNSISTQSRKFKNRLRDVKDAISQLDQNMAATEIHSLLCLKFVNKSDIYARAKIYFNNFHQYCLRISKKK